jgi:Do/DeqQ family serine protease
MSDTAGRRLQRGLLYGVGLFLLGLLAGVLLTGRGEAPQVSAAPRAEPSASRRTPVVQVVEEVSPAVVNISTDRIVTASPFRRGSMMEYFFGGADEPRRKRLVPNSLGSGVIVDPRGYVVTNFHVLMRADAIRVTTAEGTQYDAEPVGTDPSSDLAVLRIEGGGTFPAVPMGTSSDLMIGETAIAIGNPFGLGHTVTTGVISALNRSVQAPDETVFSDFIQTDAAIHPGNSGGPLLNIEGRLVGITTAIKSGAENIGFAIPVDRAERVLDELIAYGTVRPVWMGLEVWEITSGLARHLGVKPGGLMVRRVHDASPADRAGVEPGDRIVSLEGQAVESLGDWRTVLGRLGPGDRARVKLDREGREVDVRIHLEALDPSMAADLARVRLGMILGEPTRQELMRRMPDDVLVVREVVPGGPADEIGLQQGDVVTRLDGRRIRDLEEFSEQFARVWENEAIMLRVARRGNFYRVTLEMD